MNASSVSRAWSRIISPSCALCSLCAISLISSMNAQGAGERCVLAARADPAGFAPGSQGAVTLILCDAIGSPLGSAPMPFEPNLVPRMLAATVTHAAAASAGAVTCGLS